MNPRSYTRFIVVPGLAFCAVLGLIGYTQASSGGGQVALATVTLLLLVTLLAVSFIVSGVLRVSYRRVGRR
ncbi:hypothetical protein SEA_BANTAM_49 [Gordonia phage Bantam]|uniref:Uncharacterized protein n=1 Tax=Gordonia phage Bantam TaxID=1887641 RepID=A0A1B3AYA6_9CAUD|nr:hypothetical protein BIZ77_gp129 [Gordonia phage Bantam]AOE43739.1 hypothetical protein SEA_BANTAM_49 [Gordonia phage Bantam]